MYWYRPASELIFLTISEHSSLHTKGESNPMYGKHHSLSSIQKMSEAKKVMHWYNNGKENKFCYECLEGFTPRRLL